MDIFNFYGINSAKLKDIDIRKSSANVILLHVSSNGHPSQIKFERNAI